MRTGERFHGLAEICLESNQALKTSPEQPIGSAEILEMALSCQYALPIGPFGWPGKAIRMRELFGGLLDPWSGSVLGRRPHRSVATRKEAHR